MKYQKCMEAAQAPGTPRNGLDRTRLLAANVNPATGLASDYLNHFNEAIMLLELLASGQECLDDFIGWQPMTYREHFEASRLKERALMIAAYEAADPSLRDSLDALADTMNAVLEATRAAMTAHLPPERIGALAEQAAAWLRPLVARAGAVINGEPGGRLPATPQAIVDELMKR